MRIITVISLLNLRNLSLFPSKFRLCAGNCLETFQLKEPLQQVEPNIPVLKNVRARISYQSCFSTIPFSEFEVNAFLYLYILENSGKYLPWVPDVIVFRIPEYRRKKPPHQQQQQVAKQ